MRFDDTPTGPSPIGWYPTRARCPHKAGTVELVSFIVARGGIPAAVAVELACPDVHRFASTLMGARYVANADRELLIGPARPELERGVSPLTAGILLVLAVLLAGGFFVAVFGGML